MSTDNTASRWPSLEEQFRASNVKHGSRLEQLIKDNQDFDMLFPSEATDRLRLPPWLRIWWRKHHPDDTYLPNDPTGGYPLALRDLYVWMLHNQDLPGLQGTGAR
jgi:hypothetical protein